MADLPIDRPPSFGAASKEIPTDEDMGLHDAQNIFFVNMRAPDLSGRFDERLAELEKMLLLTHQLVTIHCGIQVKKRKEEGTLPSDDSEASEWKRAAYRVRVMEVYLQDGIYPWLVSPGGSNLNDHISVERTRFHWELMAKMLVGITLPRPIAGSLESIFQGISKTISEIRETSNDRTFLGVLQAFTYDEARDDLRASIRGIKYLLTPKMHEIVKTKSRLTTIESDFQYDQANFSFNERTWHLMKPEVEKYIKETGVSSSIRGLPTVPV